MINQRLVAQAAINSTQSITITDPRQPGNPLIFVNTAFERLTGYTYNESVGRNCKFLQGVDTDQEDQLKLIRDALFQQTSVTVTLRNYRKDGSLFWNEVSIAPVFDDDNALVEACG